MTQEKVIILHPLCKIVPKQKVFGMELELAGTGAAAMKLYKYKTLTRRTDYAK